MWNSFSVHSHSLPSFSSSFPCLFQVPPVFTFNYGIIPCSYLWICQQARFLQPIQEILLLFVMSECVGWALNLSASYSRLFNFESLFRCYLSRLRFLIVLLGLEGKCLQINLKSVTIPSNNLSPTPTENMQNYSLYEPGYLSWYSNQAMKWKTKDFCFDYPHGKIILPSPKAYRQHWDPVKSIKIG